MGRCLILSKLIVNSPSSLHSRLTPISRTPRGRPVDIVAERRAYGLPVDMQVKEYRIQAFIQMHAHRYPTLTHRPTTLHRSELPPEKSFKQQVLNKKNKPITWNFDDTVPQGDTQISQKNSEAQSRFRTLQQLPNLTIEELT